MISRSLGPYVGISIGIVYYLGITLLGILEVLGAVETFHHATGATFPGSVQVYSLICVVLITLTIFYGHKLMSKLGIVFFVIVCITIVLFYVGLIMAPFNSHPDGLTGLDSTNFNDNLEPDYDSDASFSVSLAVFFPTFAAIFSGADRSKKLRNPARDIPIGTFVAVVVSAVIYASFMVLWGGVAHREYLKGNFDYFDDRRRLSAGNDGGQIVKDISVTPPIIVELGIIIA
jgi:amino acid transporter